MTAVKKEIIAIQDNEVKNLKDELKAKSKRPGGFVTIIDKKTNEVLLDKKEFELIDGVKGKDNLILWSGRELAAQRLFNIERTPGSGEKDLFISWFGLGTGGADALDPLNPISPVSSDSGLTAPIVINNSDPLNTTDGYKKPFDSDIEFLQDSSNGNKWLITKATITISDVDANGNDLSEAMLYMADDTDPASVTTFIPWARVTFSTIRKDTDRELIFLWYTYF